MLDRKLNRYALQYIAFLRDNCIRELEGGQVPFKESDENLLTITVPVRRNASKTYVLSSEKKDHYLNLQHFLVAIHYFQEKFDDTRKLVNRTSRDASSIFDHDLSELLLLAFELGQISQNLTHRIGRIIRLNDGNKSREELRKEAEAAVSRAEIQFQRRGRTVVLQHAAESLGIKPRALRNRLKFK